MVSTRKVANASVLCSLHDNTHILFLSFLSFIRPFVVSSHTFFFFFFLKRSSSVVVTLLLLLLLHLSSLYLKFNSS